MCEICRSTPCRFQCPNAPEPTPVFQCCRCEESIFEGEQYLCLPDGPLCETCLEDMTVFVLKENAELADWLPLEKIYDTKWENATCKDKTIQEKDSDSDSHQIKPKGSGEEPNQNIQLQFKNK